jgi:4a-hydroxytetrahydrobiopterin dehydratase
MTGTVTSQQFQDAAGADGWHILFDGAHAYFRVDSFAAGVDLVRAIGDLSAAAGTQPDVDLRPDGVFVRLGLTPVSPHLTEPEVEFAKQLAATAREHGATADPSALQLVQISIDAMVSTEVIPFWQAVLGYDPVGDEDVLDPHRRGPNIWFQEMDEPREQRNRIHVDLAVPYEQAEARVAAAVAAGGRVVRDRAPTYWTLADPEGNEVDVATWQGRD